MSRVVHFEFPADNPEEVAEFYKNTLGWKIDDGSKSIE
jgi:predicted enzyme related to lactoylglutathione lyase